MSLTQKLSMLSVLTVVLGSQVFAANTESFVSFVPKVALDAASNSKYPSLRVQTYPDAKIEKVELKNYTLYLDQRIAALLKYNVTNHEVHELAPYGACGFDVTAAQFVDQKNSSVAAVIGRVGNLCYRLRQPETYFNKGSLFEGSFFGNNMSTLEDVIQTVVTPTQLQNTQFSFFDVPTTRSVRSAMLRIKYSIMERDYKDLYSRIDKLMAASDVSAQDKQTAQVIRQQAQTTWTQIQSWNEEGKRMFQQDRQRLSAKGRSRGYLPYDNMPDQERKDLTMYLYAMMWRFRGGGFIPLDGTQLARINYAQRPYTILAILNGSDENQATSVGASMFWVLAMKGWGKWMDMGSKFSYQVESSNLVQLSWRGLEQTEDVEASYRHMGYDAGIMKFYSAQFGSCYVYSFIKLEGVNLKADLKKPYSGFFDWPSAWGEHCAGAVFGLGLAETLLNGR